MRALPGREARSKGEDTVSVTRGGVAADQRNRIMRTTCELVAKRGYDGVTVELIVKRAKVSFKTFYKHFPSKEQCFLTLFDEAFETADKQVRASITEGDQSWPEQIVAALRTIVDVIVADPILARACIVEAPTAGPIIFERYERASKALVPLFARGRELSSHGEQLPSTLEMTLAGSVLWSAYQRLIAGEGDRIEDLLPEVIELVLRPYLGDAEAARHARSAPAGKFAS